MSVATGTTKHENDDGLSVAARLIAGAGNWIPAFAGMTMGWWHDGYFQGNEGRGIDRNDSLYHSQSVVLEMLISPRRISLC